MKLEDVLRFFDARVPPGCPLCGHEHWDTPYVLEPGKTVLSAAFLAAETQLPGGDTRVVSAICQNCGFVRLHNLGTLEQWLKLQR